MNPARILNGRAQLYSSELSYIAVVIPNNSSIENNISGPLEKNSSVENNSGGTLENERLVLYSIRRKRVKNIQ